MPRPVRLTTEDGKEHIVNSANIVSVELQPGAPGEPAVEAQDEVEDDPGEEPSATNPTGRPPKLGHPKVEAKDAVPGTPDKAVIKMINGDTLEVVASAQYLQDMIA
jgi:uncharacterized protein YlzI (FlbEa/FlbD family)